MTPGVPNPADNDQKARGGPAASKLPFKPSQNWATLKKSLVDGSSKKRKRSAQPTTKTSRPNTQIKSLTTYNPWHPNESSTRRKGNPALVIEHSHSGDKFVKPGRYVAIDCEMVGVGPDGAEDALARVSIVNYYGNVLLDAYVTPNTRVTDWRTKHSGIRPADVLNSDAQPLDKVQSRVRELINGRILVGHALKGDFAALNLSHPRQALRDTSLYEPFRADYGSGRAPSLKKVVKGELGVSIQISEHDSIEDAQAAMALYRKAQQDFEKAIRTSRRNSVQSSKGPMEVEEDKPVVEASRPPKKKRPN